MYDEDRRRGRREKEKKMLKFRNGLFGGEFLGRDDVLTAGQNQYFKSLPH